MSEVNNFLLIEWPKNLQLLSISFQRDGWYATLRCDDTWFDDTGQSLFAMASHGKGLTAQHAVHSAVSRVHELVAEINAEIPLRKEHRPMVSKSVKEEADELSALLGL